MTSLTRFCVPGAPSFLAYTEMIMKPGNEDIDVVKTVCSRYSFVSISLCGIASMWELGKAKVIVIVHL